MRHIRVLLIAALAGCVHAGTHIEGGVLGRVVVYRNGVAFYERHATIDDGKLTVRVPRDRVDDFLKSLTVVDVQTKRPMSVSIPRKQAEDASYLTMLLETPDASHAEVLLTYITEAPAWKPSYRIVVGADGKVLLEGWAVVDNISSEDWKGVLVGVGASSALAFRYDLWSVHTVDRDLLAGEEKFAVAPPTGVSPYGDSAAEDLGSLDATEVRHDAKPAVVSAAPVAPPPSGELGHIAGEVHDDKTGEKLVGVTVVATAGGTTQTALTDESGAYQLDLPKGSYNLTYYYADATVQRANVGVEPGKTARVSPKIAGVPAGEETIVVTGSVVGRKELSTSSASMIDREKLEASGITSVGDVLQRVPGEGRQAAPKPPSPVKLGDDKLKTIADRLKKDKKEVVIEVHGPAGGEADARTRGAAVRNKLVDDGIPATKIRVVEKVGAGETSDVRVLAVAPNAAHEPSAPPAAIHAGPDTPVGESHFMAEKPMTVRAGSSAMVAMLHAETTGGIVYLYDPISDRGDQRFAFRSVRLDNPTKDTLEPGPVTVYGDGKFIGEGITEPVPPQASVVVPFALDKQIVVERSGAESDRIAKLVTVQRGIVTAEIQHRRQSTFVVTSRLHVPSTVYLRHRLEAGYDLLEAPSSYTKVGDSQLFRVDLKPGETRTVLIAEATPVERSMELSSDQALDMMKLYLQEEHPTPELQRQIATLLDTHKAAMDLRDKIETLRDQLAEFRVRQGELHAQIAELKAVKSGGELLQTLKNRLSEVSDRIQKATIDIVDTQEQLMLARVKFSNQLADLKLGDVRTLTKR